MNDDVWLTKLAAYFHDPPDKAFDYSRAHKQRAERLFCAASGKTACRGTNWEIVGDTADHISAAADRECIDYTEVSGLPGAPSAPWRDGEIAHPLSGGLWQLPNWEAPPDRRTDLAAFTAFLEATESYVRGQVDDICRQAAVGTSPDAFRLRYFALWRLLRARLVRDWTGLNDRRMWDAIPATTRLPDTAIWAHTEAAAAIATALDAPAHVIFEIGPVQPFIRSARRTQDSWMGSYLISWLAAQAMEPFVSRYGPDCILYPSLWGQPLIDHYLRGQGVGVSLFFRDKIHIATLPNRFVALVPGHCAGCLAEQAVQQANRAWRQLADDVRSDLTRRQPLLAATGAAADLWDSQIERAWQLTWTVQPWPQCNADGAAWATAAQLAFEGYCGSAPQSFRTALDFFRSDPRYRPLIQVGTCYSLIHSLAVKSMDSRTVSRTFPPSTQAGGLCTCCGERSAIADGRSLQSQKAFWSRIATSLQEGDNPRYREIKPDGRERLCAVCTTKRFAQDVLKDSLDKNLRRTFPSTSTMAAADFVGDVLDAMTDPLSLHHDDVVGRVAAFVRALESVMFPETAVHSHLRFHRHKLVRLASDDPRRIVGEKLIGYDGDVLFPGAFEEQRLLNEYGDSERIANAVAKRDLLEGARREVIDAIKRAGLRPPSKYFAVIAFDGDNMGAWLEGERAPKLKEVLASPVVAGLPPEWGPVLETRRFVCPSFHNSLSAAQRDFSLELAPEIVERKYPGKLIYAGGDALLAIVPARRALQVTEDLRYAFTGQGELRWNTDSRQNEWSTDSTRNEGYVVKDNRILCLMGSTASASVGIAISHHIQPLTKAIRNAHEACERDAKVQFGRNAVAVRVLKRGGAPICTGGKFATRRQREDTPRLLEVVQEFVERFRDHEEAGGLSPGLPATLFSDADTLSRVDCLAAQQAEFCRVFERQLTRQNLTQNEELEANALKDQTLALLRYGYRLQKHAEVKHGREEARPAYRELVNWLLVARFLYQGGDE